MPPKFDILFDASTCTLLIPLIERARLLEILKADELLDKLKKNPSDELDRMLPYINIREIPESVLCKRRGRLASLLQHSFRVR